MVITITSPIEPLRAMRFIHFSAWCARQLEGGGFISVVPDFGSRAYWQGEIDDLKDRRALIMGNTLYHGAGCGNNFY